jgi:hypothetical protein
VLILILHQFPTDAGWTRERVVGELLSPKGAGFGPTATDTEVHGPAEFEPLKAVAAANGAVSLELPGAAWSRRHSRDGFDSPRAPASHPGTRKSGVKFHDIVYRTFRHILYTLVSKAARLGGPRFRGIVRGFAHHDRNEAAIIKLRHYLTALCLTYRRRNGRVCYCRPGMSVSRAVVL